MEFKGTKGKWALHTFPEGQMSVRNESATRKICVPRVQNYDESIHNLLLISKGPEMLDFIQRISGEMLRSDFVLNEKWYNQARQLIKSATQI